ncbi:sterile alpha motif domain-containing protein 9-like [Parambassis ranga]|uniref:Sterile alpha motif domain-containing protein 9-like n=1 Tax=Parambassis ranga TaxID=210632 RepID=A0A6P7IF23_9TELE|nr:sterile alpha motif domain-containing protein 9-like [Parambassis ranga]XP_028258965.1 sterile alpha motif domain-containing protein 9-like [Parambassis ranga]XP_028258966.1 sterile alpha motif domain-containing protein 9-like [Parambassis ranga]XP_028258967.1 sterile alpha motif domain-containing protein 9-like [Parambassis ranga]
MSQKTVDTWTAEDVHWWLIAEVKVHQSCADRFTEEEVLGDCLVSFTKTDILDLGIKHGPAVKITSHLERLKHGSKHHSDFPAYVDKWTKEQVSEWLLQHVKVYSKYAERLQEEGVSGDCLVCFRKQDFLDVGVKSGPAVKILTELHQLNQRPEPRLQPALQTCSDQRQVEHPLPRSLAVNEPASVIKPASDPPTKKAPSQTKPPEEDQRREPRASGATPKEAAATEAHPESRQVTVEIQSILDELRKDDLKRFHFHLSGYSKSKHKSIPQGKLEDKDRLDTATLMTGQYGSEEALRVTVDILKEINQRQLACQLERTLGHQRQQDAPQEVKKEANQGDKLKNLLTCGGNSLDSYDRFVVVVNRSFPEQLQNLQFLTKLKLFCVLDFDPNSAASGGLCHSYRASRGANLHTPSQFQGKMESVIKNLNLYKQTSWVFCNGRHDLNSDANRELDYKTWLRKSCRDVEHLVSFICNPEVLLRGRYLIIFLLLSPVDTEKDPAFDTYKSFIKHTEEENIITVCDTQSTYSKWRELIREKCDFDIDNLSINELTLSEINGTVMALGPSNQPSGRLLPSSGSSAVILKQKDEDLLTALDVLCLNQCENIYDENSAEFREFRITAEEEFYRGGKVTWWNFYLCDKDKGKAFIRREKYDNVKKMIRSQSNSKNICVLLNLFHHPGCGGTTLAMHVVWDLRQDFRCAVLKDNTLPKSEVAVQVRRLMKLEREKPSPVLLLVDDMKETENHHDLVNSICQAVEDLSDINGDDTPNCKVIILNCVRSHSPKEQYRMHNPALCQYITASLTAEEQREFEKKLKELKETHEKPENFYSFMFMKSNFDQTYVNNLARNTLESFDISTREAQLFAFLALLNTYVAKSEMALSLCEDFFEMKMIRWQEDSVLDRMKPYSNLLIIDRVEEWGGYKGIRILHHTIASACLEELNRSYKLNVSEFTMQLLHYDLFFSTGVVKHRLMLLIQRMLIERQRKKDGDDREPFSPLIHKIHSQQGRQTVQEIFMKASSRFETSASIPQALARYLYINERDFSEALKWAEKAKNIKENPYTFDTIGQVYKSNLRSNMDREKQEPSHNPEDLQTNIKIAINGMKAFQRAQDLAEMEDEPLKDTPDDDSEDYPRKSYNIYGYVCMLEIAFLVFEILSRLPFFKECDPMKKKYLQSFLRGSIPITSVNKEDNEINDRYTEIIKEHQPFLVKLKSDVKEIFDFLDCYFAYIKRNYEFDTMNHRSVCEHFKKYVHLFCTSPEEMKKEQENKSNLNLKIDIEQRKVFLEMKQADTFSGILQYLDKPAAEMEKIAECYAFLQKKIDHPKQKIQMKTNHILSNIVLYHMNPKSKHVKTYRDLSALLLETLQDVGLCHPFPDPYYLALLLFWPTPTKESTEIGKYVTAIRKSSHKHLYKLFNKRSTVAHFYLGKEEGLDRLVSKPKLDRSFLSKMPRDTLAQLWRNGDIFKEKAIIRCLHRVSGTIEQGEVYANYGKMKIPVHPARISGIRSGFSTEKVSFYLGFAINGPLAYNIKYENQ